MSGGYNPNAEYDRDAQEAALRLIIAHAPDLAGEAATAMCVPGDASRQMRLNRLIPMALTRAQGELTAEERQDLAAAMWMVSDSAVARPPSRRDRTVRLRVTEDEEMKLKDAAAGERMTVSDYVRFRVFVDKV